MNFRHLRHYTFRFAACGVIAASVFIYSAGADSAADRNPDPGVPLVAYKDVWAEFADQDPTPLIRVFGDGRILVHYAAYSPRAGQYELQLDQSELDDLLTSLLAKGLADFDHKAVQNSKALEEQRLRVAARDAARLEALRGVPVAQRTPELYMVADDSTSVFELDLSSYAGSGQFSGAPATMKRSIHWRGLRTDAERYTELQPIQQLRAAELELRAFLERPDLRRVQ